MTKHAMNSYIPDHLKGMKVGSILLIPKEIYQNHHNGDYETPSPAIKIVTGIFKEGITIVNLPESFSDTIDYPPTLQWPPTSCEVWTKKRGKTILWKDVNRKTTDGRKVKLADPKNDKQNDLVYETNNLQTEWVKAQKKALFYERMLKALKAAGGKPESMAKTKKHVDLFS